MTTTHALVPLAAALAFCDRPVPWKLVVIAAVAAAAPDVDGLSRHFLHVPQLSVYAHRGAAHSLFVAVAAGLLGALSHRLLNVRPLVAGVVVAASMASHGILDMMTSPGLPVAYLWPLSSIRLFADWQPILSGPVRRAHLFTDAFMRLRLDLIQLIIPMFVLAFTIRVVRIGLNQGVATPSRTPRRDTEQLAPEDTLLGEDPRTADLRKSKSS